MAAEYMEFQYATLPSYSGCGNVLDCTPVVACDEF